MDSSITFTADEIDGSCSGRVVLRGSVINSSMNSDFHVLEQGNAARQARQQRTDRGGLARKILSAPSQIPSTPAGGGGALDDACLNWDSLAPSDLDSTIDS